MKTGPQIYAMTKNFLGEESLSVFEQHAKTNGNETKENYKTVSEGLTTHFFPPKSLQHPRRYLHRYLFNPRGTKMSEFVGRIK